MPFRFALSQAWLMVIILTPLALGQSRSNLLKDDFDGKQLGSQLPWKVIQGKVSQDASQLCFADKTKSSVQLDLGPIASKEPVTVTFRLRLPDARSGNGLFHVGLEDIDRGRGYLIGCSSNPGYFGTSGFYDGSTVGSQGASLRRDDQWQELSLVFDPAADRVTLSQDARIVWQSTNQRKLPRVNRLVFSSDGAVRWAVDQVRIAIVRPASSAPAGLAIQTMYRKGVPHTDKNGRMLMRYEPGRSFFPIGIWGIPMGEVWGTSYELKTVVDAGFNTIWPWPRELSQTLPEAARHHLQLVHMGEIDPGILQQFGKHPNLLANVWHDEPTGGFWGKDMQKQFDTFLAYRKKAHEIAPELPVFVNDVPWITPPATDWWIRWNTSGDLACHDNYPIKHGGRVDSLGELEPALTLAVQKNQEKKPVWFIAGAFEQPGKSAFPFRFPTPAQLRACVYAGLIHGATGITYFTWDTYVCRDGCVIGMSPNPKVAYVPNPQQPGYSHPTPATPVQLAQSQSLWTMTTAINRELRDLTPAILSPTIADDDLGYQVFPDLSHSQDPVRCLLKPHPDGGYVLMTVNLDATVLDCKFQFSKPLGVVHRMFENQPTWDIPAGTKSWEITYEPFEVHVFRIEPVKK